MPMQKPTHRCLLQPYFNGQNLEATKMSYSRWTDKHIVVHPDKGILFKTKNKWGSKS